MKKYICFLLVAIALALTLGITAWLITAPDTIMTSQDQDSLRRIKEYTSKKDMTNASEQEKLIYDMAMHSAPYVAKQAHKKGDNRLIAVAMGFEASEYDAKIWGLICSAPVETIKIVYGCMIPENVYFKMMLEYNKTLLKQSGFPHKDICKLDKKAIQKIVARDPVLKKKGKSKTPTPPASPQGLPVLPQCTAHSFSSGD